jgi:FixJ family two-component response regulator
LRKGHSAGNLLSLHAGAMVVVPDGS